MANFVRVNRRLFLANLGRGTLALVVFGACSDNDSVRATTPTTGSPETTPPSAAPSTTVQSSTTAAPATTIGGSAGPLEAARFERVRFDLSSAYIVVRGSEGAIVDTGVTGSEGAIEAALGEVDLGWEQIGHVILTHRHPDHAGSAAAVLTAAAHATGYAGEGDIASLSPSLGLTALADGDNVFGLDVITTPGHTQGHVCVLDPVAGVLVAGDALLGAGNGTVGGPNPENSVNHDEAIRSVEKLAGYAYEQIFFGHGDPVMENGAELVAALAENL